MKGIFIITLAVCVPWISVQAQNTLSIPIGNLDSTNTLIETNSEIIVPPQQPQIPDMQPLPDSPNVEVAPPPNRLPQPEPMDTDLQINQTVITD